MRKLFMAAASAAALALSSGANAAVVVNAGTVTNLNNPNPSAPGSVQVEDGVTTINFGLNPITDTSFTSSFILNNTLAGIYSVSTSTSSPGVTFSGGTMTQLLGCAADFTGCTTGAVFSLLVGTGPVPPAGTTLYLAPTQLAAGNYRLTVNGTGPGNGSFTGNVTIRPAVPEPATWAMMLLGFGATGLMMRRRRTVLAQVA
ncbi:FxDxF family PEP-CTERM protein [Sphingomonas flavescens]|uniref:FxDxF family PEP-CTERM protein n=1 Tax=Sphingomonas flavescens TaxID=3132797 RepID=UPI002805217F|nr:FxDxF family PEP-CTERM protein [Sphingomonas limnosediminicola]